MANENLLDRLQILNEQAADLRADIFGFPSNSGWKMKAVNCIALAKKYVTTLDILSCVLGYETFEALPENLRRDYVTNLSATLSNLTRDGYINKARLKGIKGNYYGLPEWFEENGDLKAEYADSTLHYLIKVSKRKSACCG